jgi:hypothetical protein
MWPETLTAWSRAQRLKTSVVWATLAGSPSDPVRDLIARRLGVSLRELAVLIDGRRRTPAAQQAWTVDQAGHDALLADALAAADADPAPPPTSPGPPTPAAGPRRARPAPPPDDQIALGL